MNTVMSPKFFLSLSLLLVLARSPEATAAEYTYMKAQGYQPVISLEKAAERLQSAVRNSEEGQLKHEGTGRKTTLEKSSQGQAQVQAQE